jgi:L-fuconolactonase
MPDFAIIDTHLHVYDPAAVRYDWMKNVPKLNRRHLVSELEETYPGVAIEAFVFAEVDAAHGKHMAEAAWVQDYAKVEPRIAAMFVSLPMEDGPEAIADDVKAYAAMPLARGVRRLIQGYVEQPGWCLRAPFVAAVQSLAKHNLHFEITISHAQMRDAIDLVRRCPDVRFVLDHLGKPSIKAGVMEPWASDMMALATLPNVVCKISGAITEADHATWTTAQVAPYVAHAISAFGYDRVMFGGDWPVLTLASDYARWIKLVDAVTASASREDKHKLYRNNAKAFYRI